MCKKHGTNFLRKTDKTCHPSEERIVIMYLHLGADRVVLKSDIIGIFDLDTATVSKHTRDYLRLAEQNGDVVNVTYELPKSFVICQDEKSKNGRIVYISQLSTATLKGRMNISAGF